VSASYFSSMLVKFGTIHFQHFSGSILQNRVVCLHDFFPFQTLLIWGCTISMLLPDHWHFISIFVKRLWVLSFIFLLLSFLLKVVKNWSFH